MKTLVCTIAIGEKRMREVNLMVQTIQEHMGYDVVIITDTDYEELEHDNIIYLKDITNYRPFRQTRFNYNLKGIVSAYVYNTFSEYDRVIWSDCDVHFTKFSRGVDCMDKPDVYGRVGTFPFQNKEAPVVRKYERFINALKLPNQITKTPYLVEVWIVMIRSEATGNFVNKWAEICELSLDNGLDECYECIELGTAILMTPELKLHNYRGTGIAQEKAAFTRHRNKDLPLAY